MIDTVWTIKGQAFVRTVPDRHIASLARRCRQSNARQLGAHRVQRCRFGIETNDTLSNCLVNPFLKATYFRIALDLIEMYYHDAMMNGLHIDRHIEEKAVELFAGNVVRAGHLFLDSPNETPFIPSWSRVNAALPDLMEARAMSRIEERGYSQPDVLVSTDWVAEHLNDPSVRIIESNEDPLVYPAGHIPGAVNRPWQGVTSAQGTALDEAGLRAHWEDALEAEELVVYCGSGVTACHNLLAMEYAGLNGGRLYAGSWSEWIRDPARAVATSA